MTMTLAIEKDYTKFPGPRYRKDGPFSGEVFRDELLAHRLREAVDQNQTLQVVLDGVAGYGSSFLEEAFGGLVRQGFRSDALAHLEIVAISPRFQHHRVRAQQYIEEALSRVAA